MARNLLVGALACLALSLISPARAHTDRTEVTLDIPQQPLTQALLEFTEQAKVFHGYIPDTPEEESTLVGPLKGRYTIKAALTALLKPAGLTYSWTNARNISIDRLPPPVKVQALPVNRAKLRRSARVRQPVDGAQEQSGPIYEVVTTAFSSWSVGAELSAPVVILERADIERTGVTTIFDLTKYISQQPYLRPEGSRADGAQYAELRGLGADTTLVLINGRRASATAASFTKNAFDLNAVPLSAVERVEVLLDSTSALYGADAIGGIVNIILRKDIPDPSVDVYYGATQGGGEQRRATISAGYKNDRVNTALMLDYLDIGGLFGAERELWRNQDYRRFGSTDQRSINSSPGNITLLTGLSSDPATWLAIAPGMDGATPNPTNFLARQRNLESLSKFVPIVPENRCMSAVGSAQVDLTPDLLATVELLVVDRRIEFSSLPPLVPGLLVLPTNPFNPFGMPVMLNTLLDGMERQQQTTDSTLMRGAASLHGNLRSWDWELSALRSEEDAQQWFDNTLDFARVIQALSSLDPSQAFNVFRSGPAGSPELLASLIAARDVDRFATDASQVTGFASGPLLELPAGRVTALLGSEWRSEAVQFDATFGAFDREVAAGFAELRIPLFDADMHVPAMRELSLAVAGRFDDYSDFGGIFNPQYGLIWHPYRDLAVRASFGRSFRPPSMFELFFPRLMLPMPLQETDPRRPGEAAAVQVLTGGNPDLKATRGESFTAGLEFRPQAIEALKLSATYWSVAMQDRVTLLPTGLLLANEAQFADRVVRSEPSAADLAAGLPGRLLQIDTSRLNFGRLETSGIDLGAAYELDNALGHFSADVTATWVNEFETVDMPATPAVDRVNVANTLGTIAKWRAVATIGWRYGGLDTTAHLRYVPAYDDTLNGVRNGRGIPAQTFVDAQLALDLDELMEGDALSRGVKLIAGAANLFDQQPSFAEVGGQSGYDITQGDLKGRFWYLRLGKTF